MVGSKDKKTTTSKAKMTTSKAKTAAKKAAQGTTTSTLTASSLPTADALKERFKAGSIPLQTDFADLIDMANAGATAAGKASGQAGAGAGMRISSTGLLEPDIGNYNFKDDKACFSPVKVNADTNQIVVDLNYGLEDSKSGLSVKVGTGIKVDSDGVSVKAKAGAGITADNDGVSIKTGEGIAFDSDNVLQLALNTDSSDKNYAPLIFNNSRLEVDLGSGLIYKSNGICVGEGKGISVSDGDISVKAGSGITVDSSGVSVDMSSVIPRGIISMFSGSKVPVGWALCDGSNGTPNLIDKFILPGVISDVGGGNGETFSGDKNKKYYTETTSSEQLSIKVSVSGTTLTLAQIPSHDHIGGMAYYDGTGFAYGNYKDTKNKGSYQIDNTVGADFAAGVWPGLYTRNIFQGAFENPHYAKTSTSGEGASHSHTATASVDSHNHTINVSPPYYILAFIMKL